MNIAVHDNASGKFSQMIISHWRSRGHDVRFEMGANPEAFSSWADLIYIDFIDGNFYSYYNGMNGDRSQPPFPKKRIAVRGIDIDIWQGRHRDPDIWSYLDDFIVINQFYFDLVRNETSPYSDSKLHLIKPGVDLGKFTLMYKQHGYKIACVMGNIWEAKSGFEAIRIFQEVNRLYPDKPWELFIRGQHIEPDWHLFAYNQLIKNTGLEDRIHIVPFLGGEEAMNEWYQDKDYILVTSHKEAFSYAAAEGMAVGLKPVINNFFGSDDIWPKEYRFNSINEACLMLGEGTWLPEEYRQYIVENYDLKKMLESYDSLFQT